MEEKLDMSEDSSSLEFSDNSDPFSSASNDEDDYEKSLRISDNSDPFSSTSNTEDDYETSLKISDNSDLFSSETNDGGSEENVTNDSFSYDSLASDLDDDTSDEKRTWLDGCFEWILAFIIAFFILCFCLFLLILGISGYKKFGALIVVATPVVALICYVLFVAIYRVIETFHHIRKRRQSSKSPSKSSEDP